MPKGARISVARRRLRLNPSPAAMGEETQKLAGSWHGGIAALGHSCGGRGRGSRLLSGGISHHSAKHTRECPRAPQFTHRPEAGVPGRPQARRPANTSSHSLCWNSICLFILFRLLCLGCPFCRLEVHGSSKLWSHLPVGRIGLMTCQGFLVGRACVCVLVGGAGSLLSVGD